MKNFFKPEDFPGFLFQSRKYAAGQANKKLNALIESSHVVYSDSIKNDQRWTLYTSTSDKYIAHIVFIEEIKKELK